MSHFSTVAFAIARDLKGVNKPHPTSASANFMHDFFVAMHQIGAPFSIRFIQSKWTVVYMYIAISCSLTLVLLAWFYAYIR